MLQGRTQVENGSFVLEAQFLYNPGEDNMFDECLFFVRAKRQSYERILGGAAPWWDHYDLLPYSPHFPR